MQDFVHQPQDSLYRDLFGFQGLGFRIQGSLRGCRVQGSRVQGLGFRRVWGVQGLGFQGLYFGSNYLGPMFLSYGQPIGHKVVPFGGSQIEFYKVLGGAGDLVSKVISRVIIGVTPFRVLITLLITYLLSPLPLQVIVGYLGYHGGQLAGLGMRWLSYPEIPIPLN